MSYSITTKDGLTINNIPDDVAPDAPELKQRVTKMRGQPDAGPDFSNGGFNRRANDTPAAVAPEGPLKIGADAFPDTLRETLKNTDWGTRNIAGAGTALSNLHEGIKQLIGGSELYNLAANRRFANPKDGAGDQKQIEANKIIAHEAPVGSLVGTAALTAVPFGLAGKSIPAAAGAGMAVGATQPVAGDNLEKGRAINTVVSGVMGAGGQAVANKAASWIGDKISGNATKRLQNAPIDKTVEDAVAAGLVVPPSSVNPTAWNTAKESVAGKIATAQTASNRNAEKIDAMVRKSLGLAEDAPLTSETMKALRGKAYAAGYEPVVNVGTIKTDQAYLDAMNAISGNHQGAARSFPGAVSDDVSGVISGLKVPEFNAGDALKMTQILRDEAGAAFRTGDNALGTAKRAAAKAIEDQIERGLSAKGSDGAKLLDGFRSSRTAMAKAHTAEDALVEGGGTIDPRKFAARVQAGKPMTDEMAVIGNFANNFPKATQPAKQVGGPGVSQARAIVSGLMGTAGAVSPIPGGAAMGAAAPFVFPPLMRARLLSQGVQEGLIPSKYQLFAPTRVAGALLPYAPVAGTVGGLKTLGQ